MERPKIRIGKDFTVLWNIYKRENGVKTPYMLAAGKENYVLRLWTPYGKQDITRFDIDENTIQFDFLGKDQKHLGNYSLELVERKNAIGMVTVDTAGFTLVAYSRYETDGGDSDVVIQDVKLESELGLTPIVSLTIDTEFSETSHNAVSNYVITEKFKQVDDKIKVLQDAVETLDIQSIETAIENKVDKEDGKGLSSNDYTDEEREKLESIEKGAQKNGYGLVSPVTYKLDHIKADGTWEYVCPASGGLQYVTTSILPGSFYRMMYGDEFNIYGNAFKKEQSGIYIKTSNVQVKNQSITVGAGITKISDAYIPDSIARTAFVETAINSKAEEIYGTTAKLGAEVSSINQTLLNKQEQLVSGENIKTINGESILGKGNIVIEGKNYDNEIAELSEELEHTTEVALSLSTNVDRNTAQIKQVSGDVGETIAKLTELSEEVNSYFPPMGNIYTGKTIDAYIHAATGAIINNAKAKISEPIRVIGGKVYSLSGRTGDSPTIRCLDANGNSLKVLAAQTMTEYQNWYMPNVDGTASAHNGQFVVPKNAVYVQFCVNFSNDNYSNEIVLELVGDTYVPNFIPSAFIGFDTAIQALGDDFIPNKLAYIQQNSYILSNVSFQLKAYNLVIGSEPTSVERTDYVSWRIDNLTSGSQVQIKAKTGSSYKLLGFLSNGVVVSLYSAREIDQTLTCDGTYDSVIINNYIGYESNPIVKRSISSQQMYDELKSGIASAQDSKSIKVLCFGNSFTQNSMSYVPFILKNIAPNLDVTIGIAYIGGCTLAQHCANLTGEQVTSNEITYSPTPYTLYLYKNGALSWSSKASQTADALLTMEDWDIITFQQAGGYSYMDWETYYAPFIYKIHKAVFDKASQPVKLGWISIHGAYANDVDGIKTRWEQTTENTEKVQNLTGNEVVFPFGTSVQNLSTIASLAGIGEGAGMTADGGHLHEGLPCLAAAYANALTILREAGLEWKSIIGEGTRPTKEWCAEHGVPSPNYGTTTNDVVGVTDDNAYYAQVAAIQALKKPYELTDISMIVV